jgi:adenylate cyclase
VPLRVCIIATSVVTVLLTAAAVHVPWELTSRRNIHDVVQQLNAEIVSGVRHEVDVMLGEAEGVQDMIRRLGASGSLDFEAPETILTPLTDVLEAHRQFSWISYGQPDGSFYGVQRRREGALSQHVSLWDPKAGRAARTIRDFERDGDRLVPAGVRTETNDYFAPGRQWYRRAVAQPGTPVWTDVYVFATSGKPGLNTAVTRAGPRHPQRPGVISIAIELERISRFLSTLHVARIGDAFVLDRDGRVIGASDAALLQGDGSGDVAARLPTLSDAWHPVLATARSAFSAAGQDLSELEDVRLLRSASPDDVPHFVAVAALGFQDWLVATVVPKHAVTGAVDAHRQRLVGILALAVLAVGGAAIWVSRWLLVRPLARITTQTERMADLDFSDTARVPSAIVEIDAVSAAVSRMADNMQAFSKYLPTGVVRALHAQGVRAEVGGQRRNLSILFMDVVGFTSHTERLGHRIVPILAAYTDAMSEEIAAADGTIDKYIGDAVMAFWGAPQPHEEHATAACRAALACCARLAGLNARADDDRLWPDLQVRIGINTGRVVVGNMGSRELLDYTAIGDPVNLASRLEGLAGAYGVSIVIGPSTYEHAKYDVVARRLDEVVVKGREQRGAVYELLDMADPERGWPDGYGWVAVYERGLDQLADGDLDAAVDSFQEVIAQRGQDRPSELMIERARQARSQRTVPRLLEYGRPDPTDPGGDG